MGKDSKDTSVLNRKECHEESGTFSMGTESVAIAMPGVCRLWTRGQMRLQEERRERVARIQGVVGEQGAGTGGLQGGVLIGDAQPRMLPQEGQLNRG